MRRSGTARGSAGRRQWRAVLDTGIAGVGAVRDAASRMVRGWAGDDVAGDVATVVGELGANACLHGRPPVVVTLRREASAVVVEVTDAGPGMPVLAEPDLDSIGGRGLVIVTALADSTGVHPHATGKTVWARITENAGAGAEGCATHDARGTALSSLMVRLVSRYRSGAGVKISAATLAAATEPFGGHARVNARPSARGSQRVCAGRGGGSVAHRPPERGGGS